MEGAACSTAPQPVVGGEEQGEVGLAVHGGGGHPGNHYTSAILEIQLLVILNYYFASLLGMYNVMCSMRGIEIVTKFLPSYSYF